MIPEIGKTYKIDYFNTKQSEEDDWGEMNYKGPGKCIGLAEIDGDENQCWYFEVPDNVLYGMFCEEDIVEEIGK